MTIKEYKQERDLLVNILTKVYNNDTKGVEEMIDHRLQQIIEDVTMLAFEEVDKQQKVLEPFSWDDIDEMAYKEED